MTEMLCPAYEAGRRLGVSYAGFRCICGKFLMSEDSGRVPEHTVDALRVELTDEEVSLLREIKGAVISNDKEPKARPRHWLVLVRTWAGNLIETIRCVPVNLVYETFKAAEKAKDEDRDAFVALVSIPEDTDERAEICRAFIAGKLFKENT